MKNMMSSAKSVNLTVTNQTTALDLLTKALSISSAEVKRLGVSGCVWWQAPNQKPVRIRRLKKMLSPDDQVHCYYDPAIVAQDIRPAVLIADEQHYSVWLKPRGMFSQGTKWGDANSISRFVEQQLSRPTWLVHRLDRMTAGLIILSHQKALVSKFSEAFNQDDVHKTYLAVVSGQLEQKSFAIKTALADKTAHTEVLTSEYSPDLEQSLVRVKIHTGRKHQIRQHLSSIGHPIIGDRLYSNAHFDNESVDTETRIDLQLVAQELQFPDPQSGELRHYVLTTQQLRGLLHSDYHELILEMFR